ncbi:MAG: DHHA1 domain-containing protein [Candidatus Pacearchaeota archaeon]|nr:DHHA1 domain-containing protein [Candidatus Pacearchaeota archaeon]
MLSEEETKKIKELLDQASNPVFFFDNDVDGLASFLLLRRYCGKGKGVAIKTFPSLDAVYARKLHEFRPDIIFVLDKPLIDEKFIEAAEQFSCSIVWIDHHPPDQIKKLQEKLEKTIFYFNPLYHGSNEPVSYLCYNVVKKKEDEWIALLGCLADWFIPPFAFEFSKNNKEFFPYTKDPAKAFFTTQAGKLSRILGFALKDKTTNIIKMINILININHYSELLEENQRTRTIYKRFKQINKRYEKLLEKAKRTKKHGKLLFFSYGGPLSLSSELANELFFMNQDKIVVVAYVKGVKANISIRGLIDVRDLIAKALEGINATHGGHKNACGATLNVEDLPKFKNNLLKLLRK